MKQTRKTIRSMLAMLMALVLMLSVMPVSVFAAGTVSENYDAVIAHIAENGISDEETGWKFLEAYYEEEGMIAALFLVDTDEGLLFHMSMIGDDTMPIIVDNMFTLKKSSDNLSTQFGILIMLSDTEYDMVEATKIIDRTKVTTSRNYTITESGAFITAEDATQVFNITFQGLCGYWDNYLGQQLGFGLKGLGFTAYDGYVCGHTYDNDCDTDCNHCGEVRETSHSYGDWTEGENGCQQVCSSCGDVQTADHDWILDPGSYDATCKEDGKQWYTCAVCSAEKEETTPKTDDHSYGDWQKVDDATHSHQCPVCEKTETADHRWGFGVITQPPTEDADGIITYTCTDCGAEKTISTSEIIPGDLNGDLVVSNLDVEFLLWHTLYSEDFPLISDADFNNDGIIDNQDVEYLLWYTLYPQDFPL